MSTSKAPPPPTPLRAGGPGGMLSPFDEASKLPARDVQTGLGVALLYGLVDRCPRCDRAVTPLYGEASMLPGMRAVQQVVRCPSMECGEMFVATYQSLDAITNGRRAFVFRSTAPKSPTKHGFSAEVQGVSPSFVRIFNQAMAAEDAELDEIAGVGLRKALEFLIKDYVSSRHPGEEASIQAKFLGPCIDEYCDDPRVKACAKRAVWVGNDETHYVRKWETKDIEDLKTLIRLTANWIESHLLTEQYEKEMPSK